VGKAARLKRERRAHVPPVRKPASLQQRRSIVWAGTAGAVVLVVVVAAVLLATRSDPGVPPPAAASASDRNAPQSLIRAAAKVGFSPNVEPGVGEIESKPANAARQTATPLLPVGTTAPDYTLKTPQGETVALSQFRGKATLLEFFATWCPHCAAEAPHLRALDASLPKQRVAFVSVNADGEDPASIYAYHSYFGLQFPSLVDPSSSPGSFHRQGAAGPVTTAYRVQSYPTFYVLDPKGRIAWRSDGEQPDALLRQELLKATGGG
jgi:peroxiredoxin